MNKHHTVQSYLILISSYV